MAEDQHAGSSMIAPADPGRRIESIDLVRGFALLGILAMNVAVFVAPFAAYQNPTAVFDYEGLNQWTYRVVHSVFDLKMMSIFSMLFGAGVVMWDEKLRLRWRARTTCGHCGVGLPSPAGDLCPRCGGRLDRPPLAHGTGLWMRRMAWLFAIGMVHAYPSGRATSSSRTR